MAVTLAAVGIGCSATPALAASTCPNEAVRAESNANPSTGRPYSTELPECRAYELVSTAQKGGSDAMLSPINGLAHSGSGNFGLVFEGGARVLWEKETEPYSGSTNGTEDVYEASRGPSDWSQSSALEPAGSSSRSIAIDGASSDASVIALESVPRPLAGQPRPGGAELIEHSADGAFAPIADLPEVLATQVEVAAEGGQVFFQTAAQLGADTHSAGRQVYEWTSADGVHPVGVASANQPVSPCGAAFAGLVRKKLSYTSISADGDRAFFVSPDPSQKSSLGNPACKQPSQLYMRENGATTVEISKAPAGAEECEAGITQCEAYFVGASENGADVFFVTSTHLVHNNGSTAPNLYRYSATTHELTLISGGDREPEAADVNVPVSTASEPETNAEGAAIVSSDGTHVYFTGRGQLVPGAGANLSENESNDTVNLYLYTEGAVTYLATIGPGRWAGASYTPEQIAPLRAEDAATTPNGSDLLFETASMYTQQSSYDSEGRAELYRYDASSHTISCVSCSPTFAASTEPEGLILHSSFWNENLNGGVRGPEQEYGGLGSDGTAVFFASTEQLVPAATNALQGGVGNPIYDIYEWHEGVVSLISSGTSPASDFLIGASPSGADVFFLSATEFAPEDREHAYEIWDARTEGGFPAPSSPAECESASTCRSVEATPPMTITPATIGVPSTGNTVIVTGSETVPTSSPRPETRAERLKRALAACHRDRPGKRRKVCEREARKRYGPKPKK